MNTNIFQNDMQCLLCETHVVSPDQGSGWICPDPHCGAYYLNNGFLEFEHLPENSPGVPPIVQDLTHGCLHYYCSLHDEYERDGAFDNPPCVRRIHEANLLISG